MTGQGAFPGTDPALASVLKELRRREPIFHVAEFGNTTADFEKLMSRDYWEVGASGRRYSREFILAHLRDNPPVDAATAGWTTEQHALRQLGPETYLLTYTLHQQQRVTRRATIWQRTEDSWRILYHQGTIAGGEDDDSAPVSKPRVHGKQS
jgi:hypothetical protein